MDINFVLYSTNTFVGTMCVWIICIVDNSTLFNCVCQVIREYVK